MFPKGGAGGGNPPTTQQTLKGGLGVFEKILSRVVDHPITSGGGLVILIIGALLLGFDKITWEQFLLFMGLAGYGVLRKDPGKGGTQ